MRIAAAVLVGFFLFASSGVVADTQQAAPTQAGPAGARAITQAQCSVDRLGTAIPVASIGEPLSGVTLDAPNWTAATATTPEFCAITGSMAPIDRTATAQPINFTVCLPAT